MASSLTSKLTSAVVAASSLTRSKSSLPIVYVYVEDFADKLFWNDFFDRFRSDYCIKLCVYKKPTNVLEPGKCSILKAVKNHSLNLGCRIFCCIDADYDLLIDGVYSDLIRKNIYIITTKYYSFENLKCHPDNLRRICFSACLPDSLDVNFQEIMSRVSHLLSILLKVTVISKLEGDSVLSIDNLSSLVRDNLSFNGDGEITQKSISFFENESKKYDSYLKTNALKLQEIEKRIGDLHVDNDHFYCLMQGHMLLDHICVKLIASIAKPKYEAFFKQLKGESSYKKQLSEHYNQVLGILHSDDSIKSNVSLMLNRAYPKDDLGCCERIKEEIERALTGHQKLLSIVSALESRV